MTFEWDEKKSIENVEKHGIPFEVARQVFFDKNRKIFVDSKHCENEARYFCYGIVDGEIVTVRFTLRGKNIRIIGAGYWRKGKKIYESD